MAGEWDQRSDVLRLEVEVGGMDVSEAARLRQLEDENRRLKQLAADGSVLICFLGLTLVLIFIFVGLLQHGETSSFQYPECERTPSFFRVRNRPHT